jgi:integrase/recombinase XerD
VTKIVSTGFQCRREWRKLSCISVTDVDDYLAVRSNRWTKVTVASRAAALRAFFRHAESRGWCKPGIAKATKSPPLRSGHLADQGPKWSDVQRLLRTENEDKPAALRARAILVLFSFYGLRRSEVAGLRLIDFNWMNLVFTVRRAKGGPLQQFPIQPELADALSRYLRFARPLCSCQHVFVSLHPPYRPIHPVSLSKIVSSRMKRLGIPSRHMGPHSLRHACATHLLRQGASLQEIVLGHRDCETVGIYAKFDIEALRTVAKLDLTRAL